MDQMAKGRIYSIPEEPVGLGRLVASLEGEDGMVGCRLDLAKDCFHLVPTSLVEVEGLGRMAMGRLDAILEEPEGMGLLVASRREVEQTLPTGHAG